MGLISQLAEGSKAFPGQNRGRQLWDAAFGRTHKEESFATQERPTRGGSYGRSTVSQDASFMRLLQAMRSMAPGGWSDDRWEQTRHFVGIAYVAIDRISRQLAQAEFQVFHEDPSAPDGKRPVSKDETTNEKNGPYDLVKLLKRPNKQDSFGMIMWRWSQQIRLTGSALTWMVPNKLGTPIELYSIPTAIAIPQPAVNPDFPDGFWRIQPVYPYGPFSSYPTPNTAVGAPIPTQWMLHFKYPHPLLRYDGYSPLTGMRLHMDEVESIDRSRWYSMKRTVNPSAVLQMEEQEGVMPLPEQEIMRIKADFENAMMSPENAGRLFVSTPGSRLEQWGLAPKEMDYGASWEQLTSFILGGGFGITKPAAGMVEDSSYQTLFATLKQLHLITLEPECNHFASEITHHLAPYYGDDLIVEIRCKRIDDHDIKTARLNTLITGRAITKNELRKECEMPLVQEEWGAEIAGSESVGQEGMPGEGQEAGAPGGGLLEALGALGGGGDEQETPPSAGNLSRGALGPRKSFRLNGHRNGKVGH